MSEKKGFEYFNGAKVVYGDPYAIFRQLIAGCDGDFEGVVKAWLGDNIAMRVKAIDKLLAVSRKAFAMVPFNPMTGTGATDEEVQQVMETFFDWSAQKKTKHDTLPTPPPATDCPETSTTTLSTDCG